MSYVAAFSPDYIASRARFRSSALALGATLEEHPIGQVGPDGEALTIDVARLGSPRPRRAVVVSSGLHGVEGYVGAAIQAALLEDRLGGWAPPEGDALVLLHALNPYGFAWTRRVNEDNVDLNRNFLLPGEAFAGAPPGYAGLDGLFNPRRPPSAASLFYPRAAVAIARHGLPALKETLPVGQYEFPEGLFFGGKAPSRTQQILEELLPRWFGGAEHVVHLDIHSGMGPWGTYTLVANCEGTDPRAAWMREVFGEDRVEAWDPSATLYAIRGGLGVWCRQLLGIPYDQLTMEFGTYSVLRVVKALRAENQAHHWGASDARATRLAKRALREVFAPTDPDWRATVVRRGLAVVHRALEASLGG